jgi:hypothetical protein
MDDARQKKDPEQTNARARRVSLKEQYLSSAQDHDAHGQPIDFLLTLDLGILLLEANDKDPRTLQLIVSATVVHEKPEFNEAEDEEFSTAPTKKLPFFSLCTDSLFGRLSIGVVGLIIFLNVCVAIGW